MYMIRPGFRGITFYFIIKHHDVYESLSVTRSSDTSISRYILRKGHNGGYLGFNSAGSPRRQTHENSINKDRTDTECIK